MLINKFRKLRLIFRSLQNGASLSKACEGAGINRYTLVRWRKANSKLDEAVNNIMESRNYVVEDAMFKHACGYKYEEITKERIIPAAGGEVTEKILKVVIKEVAPDTTAGIFFLANRASDRWKHVASIVNNNTNINKVVVSPLREIKENELDDIIGNFVRR